MCFSLSSVLFHLKLHTLVVMLLRSDTPSLSSSDSPPGKQLRPKRSSLEVLLAEESTSQMKTDSTSHWLFLLPAHHSSSASPSLLSSGCPLSLFNHISRKRRVNKLTSSHIFFSLIEALIVEVWALYCAVNLIPRWCQKQRILLFLSQSHVELHTAF